MTDFTPFRSFNVFYSGGVYIDRVAPPSANARTNEIACISGSTKLVPVEGSPDHEEVYVPGDDLTFAPDLAFGQIACTVLAAPAGVPLEGDGAAAFNGSSFAPPAPGVYQLRLTNGNAPPTDVRLVAFRPQALDWPAIVRNPNRMSYERSPHARRSILRMLARGAFHGSYSNGPPREPSDADYANTTAAYPVPVGLDLSGVGNV